MRFAISWARCSRAATSASRGSRRPNGAGARPSIRPMEAPDRWESPRYNRILVAFDHSDAADFALRHAVGRVREVGARLTIVTVVARMPGVVARAGISPEQLAAEIDNEAADRLRSTAAALPPDVSVATVLRHGDPAEEILALLGEQPFD